MPNISCQPIYDYFTSTYMRLIKPEVWNHFTFFDHRTNNRVEGFHSKLNKLLSNAHPNLYHLINLFKKLETESMILMLAIENREHVVRRKKCDKDKDLAIELIKTEFIIGSVSFEDFFKNMCYQVCKMFLKNKSIYSSYFLLIK